MSSGRRRRPGQLRPVQLRRQGRCAISATRTSRKLVHRDLRGIRASQPPIETIVDLYLDEREPDSDECEPAVDDGAECDEHEPEEDEEGRVVDRLLALLRSRP